MSLTLEAGYAGLSQVSRGTELFVVGDKLVLTKLDRHARNVTYKRWARVSGLKGIVLTCVLIVCRLVLAKCRGDP